MRALDNLWDRRKWCHNHSMHGYDTKDCIDLIQEIERVIRKRELKRYIARSDCQSQKKERPTYDECSSKGIDNRVANKKATM